MKSYITGIDRDVLITALVILACGLFCFMFWWSVLQPVKRRFQYEHEIAAFRRAFSAWEHEQQCQ